MHLSKYCLFTALILALLANSGCFLVKKSALPDVSFFAVDERGLSVSAIEEICTDISNIIADNYPPRNTKLHIIYADDDFYFGEMLENKLRKKGFSISEDGIHISYTVDYISNDEIYTIIKSSDESIFTIYYALNADETNIIKLGESYSAR